MSNAPAPYALFILAISTALAGCTGPVGTPQEARSAWERTEALLASGHESALAGGPTADGDATFRTTPSTISKTYGCPGAGTISLYGNFFVDTGSNPDPVQWNYEVRFKDCTDGGGLTIDGVIDWAMTVEGSAEVYSYTGDVTWSGSVEGTCEVAMSGERPKGSTARIGYSGAICGFDAGSALN